MTDEQMNKEIHLACGWVRELPDEGRIMLPYHWHNPRTKEYSLNPEDYCNDLNTMHKVESTFTNRDAPAYSARLCQVVPLSGDGSIGYVWHATARQRAKAFLKAIGKWKD